MTMSPGRPIPLIISALMTLPLTTCVPATSQDSVSISVRTGWRERTRTPRTPETHHRRARHAATCLEFERRRVADQTWMGWLLVGDRCVSLVGGDGGVVGVVDHVDPGVVGGGFGRGGDLDVSDGEIAADDVDDVF